MGAHFTKTEQETIVLKATWELIDEMVNYEIFSKLTRHQEVTLMFESTTHKRFFNLVLLDFLSQPRSWPFGLDMPPQGAPESDRSILFHLRRICDDPKLNPAGGAALRQPLNAFVQWLEAECFVKDVWLPSIELKTDIRVKRISFIKVCGNIAKHSFARLSLNVREICEILRANGSTIDGDQGYLVLPEFYDWFHTNIFSYHSSAIAEFLNNIRWGIYDYLRPEFTRSFTKEDPNSIHYRFIYPRDCTQAVAKTMYWDLMNQVRFEPYMPKFEVTRYLKMRY